MKLLFIHGVFHPPDAYEIKENGEPHIHRALPIHIDISLVDTEETVTTTWETVYRKKYISEEVGMLCHRGYTGSEIKLVLKSVHREKPPKRETKSD